MWPALRTFGKLTSPRIPLSSVARTKIAVKVIDIRGNELMVVKTIGEVISKG
jgi:hypothetical protein